KDRFLENARTLLLPTQDRTHSMLSCEELRSIRVPVLVLAGARTPRGLDVTNEALLACLPSGTEYVKVPDAAHYWYTENPRESSRRLEDFFRRHCPRLKSVGA